MTQLQRRGPQNYSWVQHTPSGAQVNVAIKGTVNINVHHPKPPTVHVAQIVMASAHGFTDIVRAVFKTGVFATSLALYVVFRVADAVKALERACGGDARTLPLLYWTEQDKLLAEDCDDDD